MLYINDASCFIPDRYRPIEEVGEQLGIHKNHIKVYRKMYGLEKIPTASDMPLQHFIKQPIEQLIQKNKLPKEDIKYLIHCHTAKVISPFFTSIIRNVRNDLALTNATAFGISVNNCASTITSLELLQHVLQHDETSKAIIVAGDYAFTPILQMIPNTSILGDASSAILVSRKGNHHKLLSISTQIEGKYAKGVWLSSQEANEFETSYAQMLSSIIHKAIHKAGLTQDKIKIIIPHNVNLPSWKRVANYLKIPIDKIYLKNVKHYSHCFGADIFINLVSIVKEHILQKGDYYIMATVGLGAVFAAAVFQF